MESSVERDAESIGKSIGLIGEADNGHEVGKHLGRHPGLLGGGRVGSGAVLAAVGDADRDVNHFLYDSGQCGRHGHRLLDLGPGLAEQGRVVGEGEPEVINNVGLAGGLDVVKDGLDFRGDSGGHRRYHAGTVGYRVGRLGCMPRKGAYNQRVIRRLLPTLLWGALLASAEVSFNRDIRPIMSDTCFRCHGPDKNARMANLRLDIRDEAIKAAGRKVAPIVPGDPERSAVVQRIFSSDKARVMPPV